MDDFYVGEYIMYVNGDSYELGRIKSLHPDGAFVAYHEGETGAKTPYDLMHKLVNGFVIRNTLLGGDYFIMRGIDEDLERLSSPQQNDCEYWDDESNFCALHRPSPQPEITEDDVKEWLHKRHLVVIDSALYTEMKRKCAGCVY